MGLLGGRSVNLTLNRAWTSPCQVGKLAKELRLSELRLHACWRGGESLACGGGGMRARHVGQWPCLSPCRAGSPVLCGRAVWWASSSG